MWIEIETQFIYNSIARVKPIMCRECCLSSTGYELWDNPHNWDRVSILNSIHKNATNFLQYNKDKCHSEFSYKKRPLSRYDLRAFFYVQTFWFLKFKGLGLILVVVDIAPKQYLSGLPFQSLL
ncbi:hypothetical protein BGP_1180 [Beggiatoa sp. PS]|nr:hypothetical protein BGP_1180 [Beggiatoa sp. PS]